MRESGKRDRRKALRPVLVVAVLVAIAVVLVPAGSAKPPASSIKKYSLCLQGPADVTNTSFCGSGSNSHLDGGSVVQVKLKITNDPTSSQSLGSMNFDAPTALAIDTTVTATSDHTPTVDVGTVSFVTKSGTGGELQIRNLNLSPGNSATVTFWVSTPCSGSGIAWPTPQAKQSNDFNGTGNDFNTPTTTGMKSDITSGSCKLVWVYQPSHANKGALITNTAYTPSIGGNVHYVTVQAVGADGVTPLDINSGAATLTQTGGSGGSFSTTALTSAPFSHGIAQFQNFKSTAAGTSFTFTAGAPGFQSSPSNDPPFNIGDGTVCPTDPTISCDLTTTDSGGNPLDLSGGAGGFTFIGSNPFTLPINSNSLVIEPGCQNLAPVSGSGFAETDGRTSTGGSMTVTIYVDMKKIKAKYGANTGQQFIPICVGVKHLVPDTSGIPQPVNCDSSALPGDPNGPWLGDAITTDTSGSTPKSVFTGGPAWAKCGSDGFWWNIVSSYQDKLDTNPPTNYPEVTSWTSQTIGNTTYREFTLTIPAGWDSRGMG